MTDDDITRLRTLVSAVTTAWLRYSVGLNQDHWQADADDLPFG